ncbi:MAG: WYL domain-containing protein [Bryobacterales bacterium]|nr:WYL domain-containing protein [Bryobacterales bacterium]
MLETSARLLRLLSLFQRRRYWTGAGLSAELGVTGRTVRRDVEKLRGLGYPVDSSPGTEGGYQMGAGATVPPLLLDDEEAVAVAVGLGQIAWAGEAAARALGKLGQLMPGRLAGRVGALQSVVVTAGAAVAVDARVLGVLAAACRDVVGVRFRYSDHGGKVSRRRVEPYRLVCAERRWYLVGWDVDREDWRTFRVDRVNGAEAGERFAERAGPAADLGSFVREGYWRSLATCRARVRVAVSAEEAARRYPGGVFEAIDEGACYWEAGAACWDKLAMQLGWMGAEFEVEGPEELLGSLRRMRDRYGRALKD